MTTRKADEDSVIARQMYHWATELFPICRSLTGLGVRETLSYLGRLLPGLKVESIPSGTKVFDWTVPDEWTIRSGFIETESGERVVDFQNNNLHVVGYSHPIDIWLDREQLNEHLYSLPDQPDAIPYITSYYARRWGFCIAHTHRQSLTPGKYRAVIDADLAPGELNYAELYLPGATDKEIFLSTYICHPSLANNELSGPVVTAALAQHVMALPSRHYSYRIVFVPESIGAIAYTSRHLDAMRANITAGFNVTCVGDDRTYSYLPSRNGDTLADQIAQHVLRHIYPSFKRYSWLDRGSDEQQYCAPGVDLPIATIMRSKYGEYPEYHTSLDALGTVVTPKGLLGGFIALREAITVLETNVIPCVTTLCVPQLGAHGLYPTLSTKASSDQVRTMLDLISYCDGTRTLLGIANLIGQPFSVLRPMIDVLKREGLVEVHTA